MLNKVAGLVLYERLLGMQFIKTNTKKNNKRRGWGQNIISHICGSWFSMRGFDDDLEVNDHSYQPRNNENPT